MFDIYESVISNCSWNGRNFISYVYAWCDIILFIILNDAVILEAAHCWHSKVPCSVLLSVRSLCKMFRREGKEKLHTVVMYLYVQCNILMLVFYFSCKTVGQSFNESLVLLLSLCVQTLILHYKTVFLRCEIVEQCQQIVSCVCVWFKLCLGVDTGGPLMLGLCT